MTPGRVRFADETAWMTQKALAELFGVGVAAIDKHRTAVFATGELDPKAAISISEITASDPTTDRGPNGGIHAAT